jgi:serine/threonine protein kinase
MSDGMRIGDTAQEQAPSEARTRKLEGEPALPPSAVCPQRVDEPDTGAPTTRDGQAAGAPHPTVLAPPPSPEDSSFYEPAPGQRLDDFDLVRELGSGSFGRVFLARQCSLDRLVALKVTRDRGHEARTLARLEHAHIVQVFSEVVIAERNLRLLCMQFVPGTTLERVGAALTVRDRRQWSGRTILEVLDRVDTGPVPLDPAALREREFLARCDFVPAVCWLGARLAEALAHAHDSGILHRDVKPANVLLNRYGRPFLADFNLSFAARCDSADAAPFGGTVAYMAPEHLEAFAPGGRTLRDTVNERSDLYALGVVLFELLTGRLPFRVGPRPGGRRSEQLEELAAERRRGPPPLPPDASVPTPVARVISRCLEPEPDRRFASAADLARALDGCGELCADEKALPAPGPITRRLCRWPFALGCLLVLLPHVISSVVNVSYNALRIVEHLTPDQQATFRRLVLLYNVVAYPAGIVAIMVLVMPVRRVWLGLASPDPPPEEQVAAARRAALRLPMWSVLLSVVAWLPGGVIFPLGIDRLSGPIDADVYHHFLISFTISGLIALTYSFFVIEFVVLRVLYPFFWTDTRDLRAVRRSELAGTDRQLAWFQMLAVLIPLAAAVLMVAVGPEEFRDGYRPFRVLVTALIALGMTGLGVAMAVSRRLHETLGALAGGERR